MTMTELGITIIRKTTSPTFHLQDEGLRVEVGGSFISANTSVMTFTPSQ
jgi:hypothetical protein